ncbi:ABC transporter substrate-binding protein [Streptacidiphilus sp. EB129]|uniref:ABC transporter substrate-binding protein n=1 Tax=Streptacidiphilus sp. EB129 TaxID=3156262 RepID=UPI003519A10E
MMRLRSTALALATAVVLAAGATACGSSAKPAAPGAAGTSPLAGQTVSVAAVWTGAEQTAFQQVLAAFTAKTGIKATFTSTGDNLTAVVGSKIAGGDAMDVVMAPQIGVIQEFARKGWLSPLDAQVSADAKQNFSGVWTGFGTVDNTYYGLYFKAAFKSSVWYSPAAFTNAGISAPPATWPDLLKDAQTLTDSGAGGIAVGGQDGWTLTDWFENIYLSQAGPDKYDQLTKHQIPWTDPSVIRALTTLGAFFANQKIIVGGDQGALHTDFPTSVSDVFGPKPKAGIVYEGDFVAGNITSLKKTVGTDANFFPFPAVDGGKPPVMGGGDAAVILKAGKDQAAAQALVDYLASTEAATVWARLGGYLSPNRNLDPSVYPDATTKALATALIGAGDGFRFDMSDQAPPAFGGTPGAGEWKDLQDFLAKPSDVQGAATKLEADAAAAFKG